MYIQSALYTNLTHYLKICACYLLFTIESLLTDDKSSPNINNEHRAQYVVAKCPQA